MKDLYILTADADAEAVMRSVLNRYLSLEIRQITFDIDRSPMRDSGIVTNGPDLTRLQKGKYRHVLLIWDYHGSGWEAKRTPEKSQEVILDRLLRITWENRAGAVVIVSELEEWLWYNHASLCNHLSINDGVLNNWIEEYAKKKNRTVDQIKAFEPKELFEHICLEKLRRTISPRDFEEIASRASLRNWQNSPSFIQIVTLLRKWFPVHA
ncbi:MAG: hypothetical protein GY795_31505 [Desulfobacterales bacterium]|nr:hypothetical protein [Desulfobacterales bacterium]